MHRLLPLLLVLSLFVSCRPEPHTQRDIYVVSVADDFYGYNGSSRRLENVITDQGALISQLMTLGDVKVHAFLSEKGERYFSSSPRFIPVDKNGTELPDALRPSFHGFSFSPQNGDKKMDWTMKDVLEELLSIPSQGNDLVFFLYSGHGDKGTGNLLTNGDPHSTLYETMGVGNILDVLEVVGGRKILFIDACYSGFFQPQNSISSVDTFLDDSKSFWDHYSLESTWKEAWKPVIDTNRENLWILTSASTGQEALDSADYGDSPYQKSYGAFTYYLLRALGYDTDQNRAKKKQGRMTFCSLYEEIRRSYPWELLVQQTPCSSRSGIDIVLSD
ncbi:MAG: caspase family protein [Spirochaetales bacterium]|nr:caspase family protein [Candidatus Physcosoma equi]